MSIWLLVEREPGLSKAVSWGHQNRPVHWTPSHLPCIHHTAAAMRRTLRRAGIKVFSSVGFPPSWGSELTSLDSSSLHLILFPGLVETNTVAQHSSACAALRGPAGICHLQHRADEGPGQGEQGPWPGEASGWTRVPRELSCPSGDGERRWGPGLGTGVSDAVMRAGSGRGRQASSAQNRSQEDECSPLCPRFAVFENIFTR